jgi:fluoroquinolone resistance protein
VIEAGAHYMEQSFRGIDRKGGQIIGGEFYDCSFEACSFVETSFEKCRFVDCAFTECDLSLARLTGCSFTATRFEKSKLVGIDWTRALWPEHTLDGSIGFLRCALSHSTFIGLKLPGIRIRDCMAVDVDFREARLANVDFGGTTLSKSLFLGTDLQDADFSRARDYRIDVRKNKIQGAQFSLPEALSLLYCLDIVLVEG